MKVVPHQWVEKASTNKRRAGKFGLIPQGEKFYAIGGNRFASNILEDTIEEYDVASDQWNLLPNVNLAVKSETVAVKINYGTAWVFLETGRSIQVFDIDAKMIVTTPSIPSLPGSAIGISKKHTWTFSNYYCMPVSIMIVYLMFW